MKIKDSAIKRFLFTAMKAVTKSQIKLMKAVTLDEAKTNLEIDGDVISEGALVQIIAEDGTKTDVKDGDYKIKGEDEKEYNITVMDSIITAFSESTSAPTTEEALPTATEEAMKTDNVVFANEKDLKDLKVAYEAKFKVMEDHLESITKLLNQIVAVPSTTPTEVNHNKQIKAVSKNGNESIEEQIAKIVMSAEKNLKNKNK